MKKLMNLSLLLLLLIIQVNLKRNNLRQTPDDEWDNYHNIRIKEIISNHEEIYLIDIRAFQLVPKAT